MSLTKYELDYIVSHLEEELHKHILDNPYDYAIYLTTTVDYVPYGSTSVALPELTEIDDRKYMEAIEYAAEKLWEDGKIDTCDGRYIIIKED